MNEKIRWILEGSHIDLWHGSGKSRSQEREEVVDLTGSTHSKRRRAPSLPLQHNQRGQAGVGALAWVRLQHGGRFLSMFAYVGSI